MATTEKFSMITTFPSPTARRAYLSVVVTTLLVFTTGACLSYLATVLATVGIDHARTGLLVACGAIPVMLCSLVAGQMLTRLRPRIVLLIGVLMIALGYGSLAWTSTAGHIGLPTASLSLMIGGMGLFMPSAFVLVRASLVPTRLMHFVGIYGAMQLLPSLFGPTFAQVLFQSQGIGRYFLWSALPAALAVVVLMLCPDPPQPASALGAKREASGDGYLKLAGQFRVALPCWGGLVSGAVFGAMNIFVVTLLTGARTPIHHFFVPFVIAYLVTRFLLLAYIRRLPTPLAAGLGIGLMASGVATLWATGTSSGSAIASALQFGVGFSITYPVLSVWIASLFTPEASARPVALFNAIYTFGMYGSPLAAGLLLQASGPAAFYAGVVGLGLVTAPALALHRLPQPPLQTA
jgi:MFS family permease